MAENKRLGKGLGAIFGNNLQDILNEIETNSSNVANEIEIDKIRVNPYQPRKVFDNDKLQELAQSIKQHGVFQPILVRKSLNGYELISGERRTRASKLAGKKTIPAIIVEFDDHAMMEVSLLENIQREDLSAIEEAKAYQSLIDNLNYTQEVLAQRVGKSRVHITNTLRLLKLPLKIQKYIEQGKLSYGAARALLSVEDEQILDDLAEKAIKDGLSVRFIENYCKNLKQPPKPHPKPIDANLNYVKQIAERKLSTKVEVTKNKLVISYSNVEDLNRILDILNIIEE